MADTPRTLAALQALLADNHIKGVSPQDLRDFLVSAIPAPYIFRAHLSALQTIPNTTTTVIKFDVKDFDPNTNYSAGTGLYTAPISGYYEFNGTLEFYLGVTAGAGYLIIINVNGVEKRRIEKYVETNTVGYVSIPWSELFYLTAGDTIGTYVYQSTGGNRDVGGDTPAATCIFAGRLVFPA